MTRERLCGCWYYRGERVLPCLFHAALWPLLVVGALLALALVRW